MHAQWYSLSLVLTHQKGFRGFLTFLQKATATKKPFQNLFLWLQMTYCEWKRAIKSKKLKHCMWESLVKLYLSKTTCLTKWKRWVINMNLIISRSSSYKNIESMFHFVLHESPDENLIRNVDCDWHEGMLRTFYNQECFLDNSSRGSLVSGPGKYWSSSGHATDIWPLSALTIWRGDGDPGKNQMIKIVMIFVIK